MIELLRRTTLAPDQAEIRQRDDDLRRAITWAISHEGAADLMEPLRSYLACSRAWGWFETGLATIESALRRDDLPAVARAELHRHAAEAMLHANRLEGAIRELERGLAFVGSSIPGEAAPRWAWYLRQLAALAVAPTRLAPSTARRRAAERARLMTLLAELFYVSERRADMMGYGLGSLAAGGAPGRNQPAAHRHPHPSAYAAQSPCRVGLCWS